ncbi:unnamed protein product [Closterium sp. NIES-54]
MSGAAPAPPATADVSTRSQWVSCDATARFAIRNHLPATECAHFGGHRTAQALYDAVVARYSSPATAAIGRLLLPYLSPELSAFATVADLDTHLRTSDARYRAAVPAEFLPTNQPPMFITLYFIVTRLPDSLRSVRDHFLTLDPTSLTIDLLEQHLLAAETSAVAVGAARGTPRSPFFEGTSVLLRLVQSAATARARVAGVVEEAAVVVEVAVGAVVGAAVEEAEVVEVVAAVEPVAAVEALVTAVEAAGGVAAVVAVGPVVVGLDLSVEALVVVGASSSVGARLRLPSSSVSGCFSEWRVRVVRPARMLADPSGGPVVASSYTVLPCPAVPSGSLSGLHLRLLVSTAALQDAMVTTTTPGGQRVPICMCTRTGRHLAAFTRRPGSSLNTLATEPPQVAASAQVSAPGQVAASCSCRLLSHQTLLWHHRLGHPSLPRLRGMHSCLLVSGLPRSLPPLPPSPTPPCLPCVEGRQRAAPHSSSFPPTTAPLQTLHMDRFGQDLPVLHLHSDRGGEFSSDLLWEFCRGEGIRQSFTLPDSPQKNGIAERRIGLVMEVARTSMIHAAAPHFLWPFAVRYAAHQLNLWPCVSLPETSPTLRWTGKVGDASVFRVWGSRAFVRDTSADKLSARPIPCDVTFDESVPFYRFFPYRSAPSPPLPLFLALGPPPVAVVSGAASGGAASGDAEPGDVRSEGARSGGAELEGVELGGAESEGAEPGGAESEGAESGAPGAGVPGVTGAGGAAVTTGAGDPTEPGAAGAGGAGACVAGVGGPCAGGAGAAGAGAVDPGAGGVGGTVRPRSYFVPLLQQVLGFPSSNGLPPPFLCPPPDQSQPPLQPASPLPIPSPYTEQSGGLTERREPASCPVSPVRTARRAPLSRPPPVPGTHTMALRPSSVPLRVPLPTPPDSSFPEVPDPESDRARAASPTVARLLATADANPSFKSAAASALVAELLDFAAACRLDYASALVTESVPVGPPSVGGECALGTDVLEDRQEDFECLAAAVPRFASLLLAPEGDPDAKSTGSYVDEVPPPGVNIVNGMWIFRVKRPPSSPPAFKARYVARGFSQRQGVDYFQTFSPTPKMTTLRVLLHVAAQRDYELHSLDFTTAFLQGSLHEEIWLRRPPRFTGSFPAADPSLFLRTDTSLPPFYVLVYDDNLVFATIDTEALTLLMSELQKRHTCTDLGELRSYLDLQIARDRARRTITLTESHMVDHGFCASASSTPRHSSLLSTSHSLSAPPSDESVEPSGPYPELVGCLMYLMTCTRPDLAYPFSLLARYVAPGRHRKVHWDAAKRVLRYLYSTSGMGLVLGGRGPVVLTGHADASWVEDSATQRSSQGCTFSLGSGFVSWQSTRSSSVRSLSCEAEIYAGAMDAQELRWLTYLLTNLGEQPRSPPVLYVDNKAMIALCQEHRLEHRTKHIALRYFLARELQQRGQLRLAYVATRANTADVFTKALPPGDHQRFATVLGLVPTLPHLHTA